MKFGIIQHAQNGKRHGPHVNQFSVNTIAALFAVSAGIEKMLYPACNPSGINLEQTFNKAIPTIIVRVARKIS
jgi:hypothetical protein